MRFILLILLFPLSAFALDWDGKGRVSVSGAYRDFAQEGLGPYDDAWESIVFANYQSRFYLAEGLRLEATPELRGFVSRAAGLGPGVAGFATVEGPERLLDLDARLVNGGTAEWILDWERLNLVANYENLEAQLGRKPVSVGTLKVLPLWNKFSRPLPHTAGPNPVFGSDSLTLRWQSGAYGLQAIDIEGKGFRASEAVRWLEFIYYHPEIELHLMASRWWERNSAGFALAKDLLGATLRAELLLVGIDEEGERRELQGGLGAEYALDETWTVLAEGLFQSDGSDRSSEYPIVIPSRFRPLRAKGYVYLQAAANFAAFWNASVASLVNVVDGSFYPLLRVSRSLSDNIDVAVDLRGPVGSSGKEFSQKTFVFPSPTGRGPSIGAESQAMVEMTAGF